MKLEYLPDGSADCPLVRLYDFDAAEGHRLWALLNSLADGSIQAAEVHDMAGVQAVGGCRLTLRAGRQDRGLARTDEAGQCECVLTPEGWRQVAGLAEPFSHPATADGYQ